jgi:hypothetical protein
VTKVNWKHPETYAGFRAVLVLFEYGEVSLSDGQLNTGQWSQSMTGMPFRQAPIAYCELPVVQKHGDGRVDKSMLFRGDWEQAKADVTSTYEVAAPTHEAPPGC